MNINIQEIDLENQLDFGLCDNSFTVTSKLVLNAENGRISYTVVDVAPYKKNYGRHQTDYAEYGDETDKTIFLAYVDGAIAGQIRLSTYWNKYALIDDFAVDVKHRKKGVGRALIRRAVEWARAGGFPGVTLETQDINVPACRLYASCGFELRGFDTHLYKGEGITNEIALFWYLMF